MVIGVENGRQHGGGFAPDQIKREQGRHHPLLAETTDRVPELAGASPTGFLTQEIVQGLGTGLFPVNPESETPQQAGFFLPVKRLVAGHDLLLPAGLPGIGPPSLRR